MSLLGLEKLVPKGRRGAIGYKSTAGELREIIKARKDGASWKQILDHGRGLKKRYTDTAQLRHEVYKFAKERNINGFIAHRTVQLRVGAAGPNQSAPSFGGGGYKGRGHGRRDAARRTRESYRGGKQKTWPDSTILENGRHECKDCGHSYAGRSQFVTHLREHQCHPGQPMKKPRDFTIADDARILMDGRYECPRCGKATKNRASYAQHKRSMHPEATTSPAAPSENGLTKKVKVKKVRRRHGHGFRKVRVEIEHPAQPVATEVQSA